MGTRKKATSSKVLYVLDVTVYLFSPVGHVGPALRAFGSAIRSAVEGSEIQKGAPHTPEGMRVPWHIVKVSPAAEVEAKAAKMKKRHKFGDALMHIDTTHPHKNFVLSPVGRYRWKLALCSYNLNLSKKDVRDALAPLAVKVCQVESLEPGVRGEAVEPERLAIYFNLRSLPCGKPPLPSEGTLELDEFKKRREHYAKMNKRIEHREAQRRHKISPVYDK